MDQSRSVLHNFSNPSPTVNSLCYTKFFNDPNEKFDQEIVYVATNSHFGNTLYKYHITGNTHPIKISETNVKGTIRQKISTTFLPFPTCFKVVLVILNTLEKVPG